MERKLLLSRIQTPDGTILVSHHRHDYVTHVDKNGKEYMLDGGNDYQRVNKHEDAPYKDLSVYSDAPFEEIREALCRGGRGKNGDQPLTWVPLSQMNDEWLAACIIYNAERGEADSTASQYYAKEIEYRKAIGLVIAE